MVFIGNLDEVPELSAVPEGEYKLNVSAADVRTGQNAPHRPYFNIVCRIEGEENAKAVYHMIAMPIGEDDPGKQDNMRRGLKYFCQATGFEFPADVDTEDVDALKGVAEQMRGLSFEAYLRVAENNNGEDVNEIRKFTS
jgi:hypothetical protein